jgi:hypothetical protein
MRAIWDHGSDFEVYNGCGSYWSEAKQKAVEVQSRVLQAGQRVRFDVWTWASDTTAG